MIDVLHRVGSREAVDTASLNALLVGTDVIAPVEVQVSSWREVPEVVLRALWDWLAEHLQDIADAELRAEQDVGDLVAGGAVRVGERGPLSLPPEACRQETLRFGGQFIGWLEDALRSGAQVLHEELDVSGRGYLLIWNEVQRARPWGPVEKRA